MKGKNVVRKITQTQPILTIADTSPELGLALPKTALVGVGHTPFGFDEIYKACFSWEYNIKSKVPALYPTVRFFESRKTKCSPNSYCD